MCPCVSRRLTCRGSYAVCAALYFVDAFFFVGYWVLDTRRSREPLYLESAFWGEMLYLLSALFGLAAAGVSFLTVNRDGRGVVLQQLANALTFMLLIVISNFLYALDSLMYWAAWFNKRQRQRLAGCVCAWLWSHSLCGPGKRPAPSGGIPTSGPVRRGPPLGVPF